MYVCTASKKLQYDRAKAEDVRLKAMEKLSETKKRGSSADESDDKPKRQRRSGGDAIEQSTNKAFLGLSLMMPWLFLRKNRRKITLIKSGLQPRRLASQRRS